MNKTDTASVKKEKEKKRGKNFAEQNKRLNFAVAKRTGLRNQGSLRLNFFNL